MKNRISVESFVTSLRLKRLPMIGMLATPGVRCRCSCFLVGQHTAHDGRTTIRNQHFRLHALSVDARNATYGDAGVDGVVFNRDAQHNGARVGDLRSD